MYADKVDSETKRSIKDRLNGNTADSSSSRRRPISGKRRRDDDDKWEHDLFEHDGPLMSNRRTGERDLRLKLQKKSIQQTAQSVRGSLSGVRDLREKLSGIVSQQPLNTEPPKSRQKPVSEVTKPVRRSVIAEAPTTESKKVVSSASKKKTQHKVDMMALIHMTDDDLKAMGIPMGPRKKILLALESKV